MASSWKAITGGLTRQVRAAWPLLSWLFIALVLYVFVGGSIFPGWWRRFLFSGGIVDSRFWKVALEFFLLALRAGHPVALVTLVLLPLFCGWALFTMGRVGYGNVIGSITAASRVFVSLAVAVLVLTLIGLAVYPEEYLTPDEVQADLEKIATRWHEGNSRTISDAPTPPQSGFYFFLDGPRVARTFNALQKDVVVAQETIVEEGGTERRAGINLKTISGETVARKRIEHLCRRYLQPRRQNGKLYGLFNRTENSISPWNCDRGTPGQSHMKRGWLVRVFSNVA